MSDDQTLYIADCGNQRILEWKNGATSGQVVAEGNGVGNRNDQLSTPINVIVDRKNDCLIISDSGNRRVVRWPRQNGTSGETIISDIRCSGLAMDNSGALFVSDTEKNEVRRYKVGEKKGIVVAGGNGQGVRLDQFNIPYHIFVDQDRSVYISDYNNHRVMKWVKDAKEGVVVAGGQAPGNSLSQLSCPCGIIVDTLGTVYVADYSNNRVMRWLKGATQGDVVLQSPHPIDFAFDHDYNLYVVNYSSHQVQKFSIE